MVEAEIGQNLLLFLVIACVAIASVTVTVGRFNMRARFTRKPDGTVEVDEAGDQSVGVDSNNTEAKVNVVNEKTDPEPTAPIKG